MKLRRTSSDSWKLSYVSDSECSSVSMAVQCAAIAETRKRSVSVTENILEVTGRHHSVLQRALGDDSHYKDVDLHSDDEETGTVNDEDVSTIPMGHSQEGGLFEERGESDPDRNQIIKVYIICCFRNNRREMQ